ncbi:MAG: helix-turn-helix domain-containing protein [Chloroflexi bacterium]|nr:helix-turn-helix domain-containing protein [Chloroflexota bacterium]
MATAENDDRLLLRLPEVAARLGLGRTTVYDLIQRGDLPVVRVGRAVRVPVDALQRWVERQTEDNGSS